MSMVLFRMFSLLLSMSHLSAQFKRNIHILMEEIKHEICIKGAVPLTQRIPRDLDYILVYAEIMHGTVK